MKIVPVIFKWLDATLDGGEVRKVMVPHPRYAKVAERQYVDLEEYPLMILETRSRASHNHFFSAIQDGFDNLPENISARWPTSEHLRAWLLIETNWCDEMDVELASEAQAKNLVQRTRSQSPYARIKLFGRKVLVRYPKSQSAAAMGKDAFQRSKTDCLELLDHLIGQKPGTLNKEARRRA